MTIKNILFLFFILVTNVVISQNCGISQNLSISQKTQINSILPLLDSALKQENLHKIDSLNLELKTAFSLQAGIPDAVETYYALVNNKNWLSKFNALILSRQLIANDSLVYVNLWKSAKGRKPPTYQPNSIFLRASAEIAVGLLKIAKAETDISRKNLYESWAIKALDSLATMQLPNGAFPFPDLRMYGDPVFSSIIQNYLNSVGTDSTLVLQNGWIIDDRGTGEFKFDAGVIANAFYEAYQLTGKISYKNIAVLTGNYLKPLKFNINYNYNTFVSLGLTRAFQLTNDTSYLKRAITNLRYSVFPGQVNNGRWLDGHNANSRYHNIMIYNISPTVNILPSTNSYKSNIENMTFKATKNLIDYSNNCGSATGFLWLMKAYKLNNLVIPINIKDSISNLIGKHIQQAAINGKYLNVPTMGEYFELLNYISGIKEKSNFPEINVYPNPTSGIIMLNLSNVNATIISLSIYDNIGKRVLLKRLNATNHIYNIDLQNFSKGLYFIKVEANNKIITKKIIKN